MPALVDHSPVCFVAIHGDVHPATAGGNPGVEAAAADFGEEGLEGQQVVESTGLGYVSTVEQGVNPHRLDALVAGTQDHRPQVIDMACLLYTSRCV